MKKLALLLGILCCGCVADREFDAPKADCAETPGTLLDMQSLKELYVGETLQLGDLGYVEGYVASSDAAGNFFGTLYIQDRLQNPTQGLELDIDLRDAHLFYPVGSKIYVKLEGLYLGKGNGGHKLGGSFSSFGNLSVGRLPSNVVGEHLLRSCSGDGEISRTLLTIPELSDAQVHTLVQVDGLEVPEESLGQMYAEPQEETERVLHDCEGNEMVLLNSGYADFQASILPNGNGSVTGILIKDGTTYQLVVRDTTDLQLTGQRCPPDKLSSDQVFISELADPDNNAGARFVELYNASDMDIPLKEWTLRRYTNANTEISSTQDLSGYTIAAKSTFVIAANAEDFELVYGFAPDLSAGTNGPADSNGDDNLELVDPFGTVVDVFGRIGEDGSGTDHEFEDGKALRLPTVLYGNPLYDSAEWELFNDTGAAGTQNLPQLAPEDFTPGQHTTE